MPFNLRVFAVSVCVGVGITIPAGAAPVVGAEVGVGATVPAPALGSQAGVRIASDGNGYLAVWPDERAGEEIDDPFGTRPLRDIFGARFDAAGQLVDPLGFPVTAAPGPQEEPDVAFDGTDYLVVWKDGRSTSYTSTAFGADLYAVHVTSAGAVVEPGGVAIGYGEAPSVACDPGGHCLVVWADMTTIYGERLDPALQSLDATPLTIGSGAAQRGSPSVAWSGDRWIVAWADWRSGSPEIYGARVAADGTPADGGGVAIGSGLGTRLSPRIAFDGTHALVTWDPASTGPLVVGTRVDPASFAILDPGGVPAPVGFDPGGSVAAAFNGGAFILGAISAGSPVALCEARVQGAGTPLAGTCASPPPAYGSSGAAAIASTGGTSVVLGSFSPTYHAHVYGARFDAAATTLDSSLQLVTGAGNGQQRAAAAFDGSEYLLVWEEERAGNDTDIYGARVAADGTLLDPEGFAIASAPGTQRYPSVAAIPGTFLVTWEDLRPGVPFAESAVYVARVTGAGAVLDPAGIPIASASSSTFRMPAVAADGAAFLVAWHPAPLEHHSAAAVRFTASGTVLDPAPITVGTHTGINPKLGIAYGGGEYLMVWADSQSGSSDLYGARFTSAGVMLDASPFAISTNQYDEADPVVTWAGSAFVVAWQDSREFFNGQDVYATRVSPGGGVLDPDGIAVASGKGWKGSPKIAFDGLNTIVTWQDDRSGSGWDAYGARIDASGAVLDPGGFAIAADAYSELDPAIASDGTGRAIAAYHRYDPGSQHHAARVFLETLTADDVPDAGPDATADAPDSADVPDAEDASDATTQADAGPDATNDAADERGNLPPASAVDTKGCGCRAAGGHAPDGTAAAAWLLVALIVGRRRASSGR